MPRLPLALLVAAVGLSICLILPTAADVFVCDVTADTVRWFDDAGTLKGSLTGNGLDAPAGITRGPDGKLYVASAGSAQVLRYDPATGAFLEALVQPGNGLIDPNGIAFGGDGSLFVANASANNVLRYDGETGAFLGTLTPPTDATTPIDIATGPDGDVFVNFSRFMGSYGVYRYDGGTGAAEGWFTDFGNSPTPWHGQFGPDGQLYTPLYLNDTIQRTTAAGVSSTFATLDGAIGLTFLPDGDLLVTSSADKQVHRIDGVTGADLGVFASGLVEPTAILHVVPEPASLAVLVVAACAATRRRS